MIKMNLKTIVSYIIVGLIISFSVLNHEIGHVIMALWTNTEVLEIGLTSNFAYVLTGPTSSTFVSILIAIFGTVWNLMIFIVVFIISIIKEKRSLYVSSMLVIWYEYLYVVLIPFTKFGDWYRVLKYLENVNVFIFIVVLLTVLLFILLLIGSIKMFNIKNVKRN